MFSNLTYAIQGFVSIPDCPALLSPHPSSMSASRQRNKTEEVHLPQKRCIQLTIPEFRLHSREYLPRSSKDYLFSLHSEHCIQLDRISHRDVIAVSRNHLNSHVSLSYFMFPFTYMPLLPLKSCAT